MENPRAWPATWSPNWGWRDKLFFATKVWTSGRDAGIRQMEDSFRLMRTQRMDLMQVHNLLDLQVHAKTLRDWKAAGRIRYVGITHYHDGAHAELEKIVKTREWDFVQFNYSNGGTRERRRGCCRPAPTSGTAVLVNRRFAGGPVSQGQRQAAAGLGRGLRLRELGAILPQVPCSESAVTCVIPGTRAPTI